MADQPDFSGWLEGAALAIWLFIHLLVPLVYLIFFARYLRLAKQHPEEPWDRLMLINLMGLSLFASIAFTPNWFKISSSTLPALIIFVWFLKAPGKLNKALRSLLWFAAISSAVAQPLIAQTSSSGELNTPIGRAAFNDDVVTGAQVDVLGDAKGLHSDAGLDRQVVRKRGGIEGFAGRQRDRT